MLYRNQGYYHNNLDHPIQSFVISTHVDKNHIHNHIIFNAASFVDHHKYVSNKRSYHKLCRISNRICHKNGLATSMPTGEKSKNKVIQQNFSALLDAPEINSDLLPAFSYVFYHKCFQCNSTLNVS